MKKNQKCYMNYFYKIDKRIDDKNIYNFKGKNFSVEYYKIMKIKLLMNLYDYFQMKKIKMMTMIFDGILLLPNQAINIADIENYLFVKTSIFL